MLHIRRSSIMPMVAINSSNSPTNTTTSTAAKMVLTTTTSSHISTNKLLNKHLAATIMEGLIITNKTRHKWCRSNSFSNNRYRLFTSKRCSVSNNSCNNNSYSRQENQILTFLTSIAWKKCAKRCAATETSLTTKSAPSSQWWSTKWLKMLSIRAACMPNTEAPTLSRKKTLLSQLGNFSLRSHETSRPVMSSSSLTNLLTWTTARAMYLALPRASTQLSQSASVAKFQPRITNQNFLGSRKNKSSKWPWATWRKVWNNKPRT